MQSRPLSDYVVIIIVLAIAVFVAQRFFPRTEITRTETVKWLPDTVRIEVPKIIHDHIPAKVTTDTAQPNVKTVFITADTMFADSAKLFARAAVVFPQMMGWIDIEYTPAPQNVVIQEKVVTQTVLKTETVPDWDWVIGAAAVGVVTGVVISNNLRK